MVETNCILIQGLLKTKDMPGAPLISSGTSHTDPSGAPTLQHHFCSHEDSAGFSMSSPSAGGPRFHPQTSPGPQAIQEKERPNQTRLYGFVIYTQFPVPHNAPGGRGI